jgi:hypothetical protein
MRAMNTNVKHLSAVVLALTLAVIVGVLTPTSAAAQPPTRPVTVNYTQPFESAGTPLCGGEEVVFGGEAHFVIHQNFDDQGGVHSTFHMNYQRVTATGVTSGTRYRVTETATTASHYATSLPTTFTTIINGQLVGPGPANNTGFHLQLHTTILANGETTSEIFNESLHCNG